MVRGADVGVIGWSRCWEDRVIGSMRVIGKERRVWGERMGVGVKEVRCG